MTARYNVLAAALIATRAGLAKIRPRWPVFDLAFAAYWSAVCPGEPLPVVRSHGELDDTTEAPLEERLRLIRRVFASDHPLLNGVGNSHDVRARCRFSGFWRS